MIVVSDTSPLNYLILIEQVEILPQMHGSIYIPPAVHHEMQATGAPGQVRQWAAKLPSWVIVKQPQGLIPEELDAGESQAITLALETNAEYLLIDERDGRRIASQYGIRISGVLGQLKAAAQAGLLDFDLALHRLLQTNYHTTAPLVARVRAELGLT